MKHRLHVLSLPHTQTTRAYSSCAYTEKVRKFCIMMREQGNEVFLYSGDQNEAACSEHIECYNEGDRALACAGGHYTQASYDPRSVHWTRFNNRAAAAIRERSTPWDIICATSGTSHKPVADALPHLNTVEYAVGYGGVFSKFRVFESYAWMHAVYGAQSGGDPHRIDGLWFDDVIHGYLEPEAFPLGDGQGDDGGPYVLYLGRMIERKGIQVAREACQAAGVRLVTAGPGLQMPDVEHRGEVGPEERARMIGYASAVIMPTVYCEPFGNVAIEAQACGTPVITTDWGAFTETVRPGESGFRCRSLQQFVDALRDAPYLDREAIRRYAIDKFGLDHAGLRYQDYFDRLATTWGRGWYQLREETKS
jgi:glycosyltransferase involved in cell wall biosynthesis